MDKPEVIIFIPTREEYQVLSDELTDLIFTNFRQTMVLTNSGHQATMDQIYLSLAQRNSPKKPWLLVGAGSCTTSDPELNLGATLASCVVIEAWGPLAGNHRPGSNFHGGVDKPGSSSSIESPMTYTCRSPLSHELTVKLRLKGFSLNPICSLPWPDQTLNNGLRRGDCLTYDMESAAVAQVGTEAKLPWINIRMVTDTFNPPQSPDLSRPHLIEDLALKLIVVLSTLDQIPHSSNGCGSCTSCRPFG